MTNKRKLILADASAFIVAVGWGLNFNVMKWALSDITPLYYLAIRFIISGVVMAVVFFRILLKSTKKDVIAGVVTGFFLAACFASQTIGLQYTTPGKAGFLSNASVIIVPFLAWILYKKKLAFHTVSGAVIAFLGLALISLTERFTISPGDSLALLSALFFALQIISVDFFANECHPARMAVIQVITAGAICTVLAAAAEPLPHGIFESVSVVTAIVYGVVVCTILSFLVQAYAQKVAPPSHMAIILCFEAVFALVFSLIIGYEEVSARGMIGCVVVFAGFILSEVNFGAKKKENEQKLME